MFLSALSALLKCAGMAMFTNKPFEDAVNEVCAFIVKNIMLGALEEARRRRAEEARRAT
jgi:hypothetical protein